MKRKYILTALLLLFISILCLNIIPQGTVNAESMKLQTNQMANRAVFYLDGKEKVFVYSDTNIPENTTLTVIKLTTPQISVFHWSTLPEHYSVKEAYNIYFMDITTGNKVDFTGSMEIYIAVDDAQKDVTYYTSAVNSSYDFGELQNIISADGEFIVARVNTTGVIAVIVQSEPLTLDTTKIALTLMFISLLIIFIILTMTVKKLKEMFAIMPLTMLGAPQISDGSKIYIIVVSILILILLVGILVQIRNILRLKALIRLEDSHPDWYDDEEDDNEVEILIEIDSDEEDNEKGFAPFASVTKKKKTENVVTKKNEEVTEEPAEPETVDETLDETKTNEDVEEVAEEEPVTEEVVEKPIEEQVEEPEEVEKIEETVELSETVAEPVKEEPETPVIVIPEPSDGTERSFRYDRSLTAKIIQNDNGINAQYYSEIKNYILSFKGVKSRVSWDYDTFKLNKEVIVKISIRGKALSVYLALNPSMYEATKYNFEDMTDKKKFSATPMLIRVRSDRGLRYCFELIDELMKINNTEMGRHKDVDYTLPYETSQQLLKKGLVKLVEMTELRAKSKKKTDDDEDDDEE